MSGPGTGVTVVIPVWDRYVEFLPDAVESVRRNGADVPIVVVDNASSTSVPDLEGCEIVRSPTRLTVGAARNFGLQRVATEFVVVLDADDMLLDGALELMHGRLAGEPSLSISAMSILDGATGERHRTPRRIVPTLSRWPRVFALANSIWSLLPIQGCAIMRTQQVRQAGGYPDADLGEDWALAVSLAWRGRIEVSERLGRYYRSSKGSFASRAWTGPDLRANARRVRERMRGDSAVPGWARTLVPAIAALQLAAIHLAQPAWAAVRRLTGGRQEFPYL